MLAWDVEEDGNNTEREPFAGAIEGLYIPRPRGTSMLGFDSHALRHSIV